MAHELTHTVQQGVGSALQRNVIRRESPALIPRTVSMRLRTDPTNPAAPTSDFQKCGCGTISDLCDRRLTEAIGNQPREFAWKYAVSSNGVAQNVQAAPGDLLIARIYDRYGNVFGGRVQAGGANLAIVADMPRRELQKTYPISVIPVFGFGDQDTQTDAIKNGQQPPPNTTWTGNRDFSRLKGPNAPFASIGRFGRLLLEFDPPITYVDGVRAAADRFFSGCSHRELQPRFWQSAGE